MPRGHRPTRRCQPLEMARRPQPFANYMRADAEWRSAAHELSPRTWRLGSAWSGQAVGTERRPASPAFIIRQRSVVRLGSSNIDVCPTAPSTFLLFGVVTTNGCAFSHDQT